VESEEGVSEESRIEDDFGGAENRPIIDTPEFAVEPSDVAKVGTLGFDSFLSV